MIDVARDETGILQAIGEILEEDFLRGRLQEEAAGAGERTRQRLLDQVPRRTLSPGYYAWAAHLLQLQDEHDAGVLFAASELAAVEGRGLSLLAQAKRRFAAFHPECGACGARQPNRFGVKCCGCGAEFRRKGA